ncbi:FecR family protein [Mucilaginibacter aquariorum]|uniref:DUF4974 domain-containing protein n=1 Tax=Mucilaginibacter aquariorum TaxID=2967225 RepID=A0ABT1T1X5_9SPHI|nr:FecR domain-containing protein [Mucilaginibacter aquariorum]MCQ6958281.1 DUF4974 domain-containing protein [Mucilaginibacter aquariorum]
MEKKKLTELFKKYHQGTCTEEEKALLEAWYLQHNEADEPIFTARKIKQIGKRVFRELPGNEKEFLTIGSIMLTAAAILGALIAVTLFYVNLPADKNKNNLTVNDIAPGSNKAILKLADGKSINLTDAKSGALISQKGTFAVKDGNGKLAYNPTNSALADHSLNTVETPNGGQWKVQLSDGTNVWLNAASSITFPASFAQLKTRQVSIKGEAYFEVAKDKAHPFIVRSNGQQVEVLGTHFNINSYTDEPASRTTLAEGRIKISTGGGSAKYLTPGQEASLNNGQIIIVQADVKENLSWVKGQFWFNDESVQSVMRKIARWYDVEIQYEGTPSSDRLNGRISRDKNISQVLKALAATQTLHFKMEGRRIIVMK